MGVPAGVKQRAISPLSCILEVIDEVSFAIALVRGDLISELVRKSRKIRFDLGERRVAVHLGLSGAEKIEVWSV